MTSEINRYIYWDFVSLDDDSYREAKRFEKATHPDLRSKVEKVFLDLCLSEVAQAESQQALPEKAYFYGRVRKILGENCLLYNAKAEELRSRTILREASVMKEVEETLTDPSERAAWVFKAAYLTASDPTKFPVVQADKVEQWALGSNFWETLGDLFATHKKNLQPPPRLSFLLPESTLARPKFTAAILYEWAAYAIRNPMHSSECGKSAVKDLCEKSIRLIDKSIEAMETVGLKVNDTVFNAFYFERLAGLYQLKLHSCKIANLKGTDKAQLAKKIGSFRKKSAKKFEKLVKDLPQYHFHLALNLSEAALHAKNREQMVRAGACAMEYLEFRRLPLFNMGSFETEEEWSAFYIYQLGLEAFKTDSAHFS